MRDAQWLAGAFSAWGLASTLGARKRVKISLMTASDNYGYIDDFANRASVGRVETYKGRWHWVCDDPNEVRAFLRAVGPHLTATKLKMIETAWESWRQRMLEATDGEVDSGAIDEEDPTV